MGRKAILDLAAQPVVYAWKDIVVMGTIAVLAGGPGEGKTTLLFLILVARATRGGPVQLLSRHIAPVPPDKWIVLIEGEHSESSASRKLTASMRLLDVDENCLDRFIIVARKQVVLGSPEWLDVQRLVAAGLVSDIAIDTLARVAPGDANDEQHQVRIYDSIAAAIDAAPADADKPVVWIVAHTKKTTTGEVTDVSGSSQRVGQTDALLLVKGTREDGRVVSSRVTFAKLREDPDDYPVPVDFSIIGRVLRQDGHERDDRPLTVRLAELLRTLGVLKKIEMQRHLKRNGVDIEAAITALFAEGRLRKGSVLVRGKLIPTFELVDRPPVSTDDWADERF